MDPLFELQLDRIEGSRHGSQTLYQQLREAIIDGRLARGARLPATRKAQQYYGVSRHTAAEVYAQLLSDGYLIARHGSGTFVAERLPKPPRRERTATNPAVAYPLNDFWQRPEVVSAMGFWRDTPPSVRSRSESSIDLRPGLVDWQRFPFEVFRRINAQQLRLLERKPPQNKSPQGNQGNYSLRAAIARHIAVTRAVACQAEDILVTSGAQQAFDLLARTLVTAGKTVVAIEDPGYPPMRVAFAAAGARLVPVPVDTDGLIVDRLPADARVICLCPSHQFPLGVTLSAARRAALIEFAARRGAVIVEDDYDGEFRFEGASLPALWSADAADVVFYVGTFSKCMLPAFRLGFVVMPGWAKSTLISAKNCLDWHSPTPIQNAVAKFIADGHLTRHVRRMREIYGKRRELLLTVLKRSLPDWLEPLPSFYGMHLTAIARAPIDLESVAQSLLAGRVHLHTLGRYYLGEAPYTGLVLGYGATETSELSRGLTLLRRALASRPNG